MMKYKSFIFLTIIFLLVIFFFQFKLINHPVTDNDEGIYLTSFLLVNKGHLPYKETFFSQPPGFLLSVYPGFILLGKTLQSARLIISIWSLFGLLAILWLGFEFKNKWASLLTISLLFLTPSYFNQISTFQSDILIVTFSLLSLVTLVKYNKSQRLPWFILSVLFLNLAFWTKFDITFIPSFILVLLILFKERKTSIKNIVNLSLMFFSISLLFFILLIFPFGLKEIFSNSILLRFQAVASSPSSFLLLDYLKKDRFLLFIILGSLILSLLKKIFLKYPLNIIFVWSVFILILLVFYRPLFPHHLVILTVPFALLFSQVADQYINNKKLFRSVVVVILIISLGNRIYLTIKTPAHLLNDQQQRAVVIIQKETNIHDVIISDEEILSGLSGRLPPPALSDISQVRIRSGNLTSENFKNLINIYKPKLIIPWNGRLELIKNFHDILIDYRILTSISPSKNIYIRIDQ